MVAASARDGGQACAVYEDRKRSHQNTAAMCRDQGLQFVPLVCGGGWGPEARKTWRTLGGFIAARTGQAPGTATEHLRQFLSVTLQRELARAVLRRLSEAAPASPLLGEP